MLYMIVTPNRCVWLRLVWSREKIIRGEPRRVGLHLHGRDVVHSTQFLHPHVAQIGYTPLPQVLDRAASKDFKNMVLAPSWDPGLLPNILLHKTCSTAS